MSEQSRAFDAWLDGVIDGNGADASEFARSAIGDVPKIEARVTRLNPKAWGFKDQAAMDAAWGETE